MEFAKWEDLTERDQLLSTYSDTYKDAYGVRPQGYSDMPVEWLKDQIDFLTAEIVRQIKAQRD